MSPCFDNKRSRQSASIEQQAAVDRPSEFVEYASTTKGSALDQFLGGLAIVRTVDGFAAGEGGKVFVEAWLFCAPLGDEAQLSSTKSSVQSMPLPPTRASFVYNSVLALGLGLCRQRAAAGDEGNETASVDVPSPRRYGASPFWWRRGRCRLTGERGEEGATFGVYNVRRVEEVDTNGLDTGAVRYLLFNINKWKSSPPTRPLPSTGPPHGGPTSPPASSVPPCSSATINQPVTSVPLSTTPACPSPSPSPRALGRVGIPRVQEELLASRPQFLFVLYLVLGIFLDNGEKDFLTYSLTVQKASF